MYIRAGQQGERLTAAQKLQNYTKTIQQTNSKSTIISTTIITHCAIFYIFYSYESIGMKFDVQYPYSLGC